MLSTDNLLCNCQKLVRYDKNVISENQPSSGGNIFQDQMKS